MSQKRPGRQTRPAYTTKRRSWYGYGKTAQFEKSGFGRFLHDTTSIFGEVSILGLPALLVVTATGGPSYYGLTTAVLVAWATMVFVGTLIRGGWIRPLATDVLGWVSFSAALLGLRLVYYNAVLLLAGYGSTALADAVGVPALSLVTAAAVAAVATLAFPRLGEAVARWRLEARRR